MTLRLLVPIALGICSVLQAGLNKKAALKFDLSSAAFMNSAVLFVISALLFFATAKKSELVASGAVEIWNFLPGLLGICLVAGIPWAISKWGTTPVFVGLMASQVISSLVWDLAIEKRLIGSAQISGALLSVVSVVFVNQK